MNLKELMDFLKEKGVEDINKALLEIKLEIEEHLANDKAEDERKEKEQIFGNI